MFVVCQPASRGQKLVQLALCSNDKARRNAAMTHVDQWLSDQNKFGNEAPMISTYGADIMPMKNDEIWQPKEAEEAESAAFESGSSMIPFVSASRFLENVFDTIYFVHVNISSFCTVIKRTVR